MFKGLTSKEFRERFGSERSCLEYLVQLKWSAGYKCSRCEHDQFHKGRKWHYRRCRKCAYDESATSGTLFHQCKLGMVTAFEMVFRIAVKKKGMSSCELAREFGCQQKSAWLFKAKVQEAMKSSGGHPLASEVEVDEFVIGGPEQDKPGRSHGKKKLVVLGIERVTNKKGKETIGRAYAQTIDASSAPELADFFHGHVDENAAITTDGWRGYAPMKGVWKVTQKKSEGGANFQLLHIHIMNIKNWIRGIHHKCSAHRLQKYLDEFHFRFNRRGGLQNIFQKIIEKAVLMSPMPYSKIKLCELNG